MGTCVAALPATALPRGLRSFEVVVVVVCVCVWGGEQEGVTALPATLPARPVGLAAVWCVSSGNMTVVAVQDMPEVTTQPRRQC